MTEKNGLINVTRDRYQVSDIVWCLERTIDEDVHESKFPGTKTPVGVSENASEPTSWNANNIRSTWLKT